jgi:hypothetical protein
MSQESRHLRKSLQEHIELALSRSPEAQLAGVEAISDPQWLAFQSWLTKSQVMAVFVRLPQRIENRIVKLASIFK